MEDEKHNISISVGGSGWLAFVLFIILVFPFEENTSLLHALVHFLMK